MGSKKKNQKLKAHDTGLANPYPSEIKAAISQPTALNGQPSIFFEALPEGCPSNLQVLKKLIEDVNYARKLNPKTQPVSVFALAAEAVQRSCLIRSAFEKTRKHKPIFLTDTMKLATKTFFESKPKQARGKNLDKLIAMMSVTYGCEALAEMTMSQIKDLALERYNRIVSTDRISNSAGYNNIVGAVCSSRRESQKKEIDPRQRKKN